MTTPTSRRVSMISRNYKTNPVIDVRYLVEVHALYVAEVAAVLRI